MGLDKKIEEVFNIFQESIDLQDHQSNFCSAPEDLVFFGGGAGGKG